MAKSKKTRECVPEQDPTPQPKIVDRRLNLMRYGIPTLYGLFDAYQNDCADHIFTITGRQETPEHYRKLLEEYIIFPHFLSLHFEKSILDYTKDQLISVIEEIKSPKRRVTQRRKSPNDDPTAASALADEIQLLLETIFYIGAQNNLCADIFKEPEKAKDYKEAFLNADIIGSFTPKEEYAIARQLTNHCNTSGEAVGLLLMFALGLRSAEACMITFDNICSYADENYPFHYLWVPFVPYEIYQENKNSKQILSNFRCIPLPDSLYSILMQLKNIRLDSFRKQNIQPKTSSLPIVCKGTDYEQECDPLTLDKAGRQLLRSIGISDAVITATNLTLLRELKYEMDELYFPYYDSVIKPRVIPYLFRKNFGTHLTILQLSEEEKMYILGHSAEYIESFSFGLPTAEDIAAVKKKMDLRPIFNKIEDRPVNIRHLQKNEVFQISNVGDQIIHIPQNSQAKIHIRPNVAGDNVKITVLTNNENYSIRTERYTIDPGEPGLPRRASLLKVYHKSYKDVIQDYVISL